MNNSIRYENSILSNLSLEIKEITVDPENLFENFIGNSPEFSDTPEPLNNENKIQIKQVEDSVVQSIFSSQVSLPPPTVTSHNFFSSFKKKHVSVSNKPPQKKITRVREVKIDEMERLEKRRLKNQLSAKRLRENQKKRVEGMEEQIKMLSLQNEFFFKFCEDLEVNFFPNQSIFLSWKLRNSFANSNSESQQSIDEFKTYIFEGLNERETQRVNMELENHALKEKLKKIFHECSSEN